MANKGIDISKWQGNINFSKVANSVDFVIIREGYRQTIDSRFMSYVAGCRENNIPIHGVYHFCYATSVKEAIEEAVSCISNMEKAGLGKDVIVFYDFEYDTVKKAAEKGVKLGKDECIKFTDAFCSHIESMGYKAGIYCNLDYYKNMYNLEILSKYVLWLADYVGEADFECTYHQYTSKGSIPGISGNVDMVYLYDEKEETEVVSKLEKATRQMEEWAMDDSHGYDQKYRWGEKGDFDCSAAVFQAWENAGVPVKTYSFEKFKCAYTGVLEQAFEHFGFKNVTASVNLKTGEGLTRGDVLLNNKHHVAMYCGNGKEVEASINEKGTATGGTPGDQTGKEFLIRSYRNYPWTHILRYEETGTDVSGTGTENVTGGSNYMFEVGNVKSGSSGNDVRLLQILLKSNGIVGKDGKELSVDGKAGANTDFAIRQYQKEKGLAVDGCAGPKTWKEILLRS